MKQLWDEVVICCPEAVTGGPEALHQLGSTITKLGGAASFAYFGAKSTLRIAGTRLQCDPDPQSVLLTAFARYEPRIARSVDLREKVLLVVPELMAETAAGLGGVDRAVWWLSVDNALARGANLAYEAYRRAYFANGEILHLFQSYYAYDFLTKNRAKRILPLFDYVAPEFQQQSGNRGPRSQVALFPAKGGVLANRFMAGAPDLDYLRLEHMTRDQVADALGRTAVYLDFGHQPGKDRVPREAAAAGAVVLLHQMGAANFYLDHPLDDRYVFTRSDVESGALERNVRSILEERGQHLDKQATYRQRIVNEHPEFELQVANAFFAPDRA